MKEMKDSLKRLFTMSIFTSVILIVIGLLFIFYPGSIIQTISYIIGGVIILFGVFEIARYTQSPKNIINFDLIYGLLSLIAGIIVILNYDSIATIIPIILGVFIVINSAFKLQYSINMKMEGNSRWLLALILSLITLACGIVLLLNPFKGVEYVTQAVGVTIVIYSVVDIIESFVIRAKVKEIAKDVKMIIDEN